MRSHSPVSYAKKNIDKTHNQGSKAPLSNQIKQAQNRRGRYQSKWMARIGTQLLCRSGALPRYRLASRTMVMTEEKVSLTAMAVEFSDELVAMVVGFRLGTKMI